MGDTDRTSDNLLARRCSTAELIARSSNTALTRQRGGGRQRRKFGTGSPPRPKHLDEPRSESLLDWCWDGLQIERRSELFGRWSVAVPRPDTRSMHCDGGAPGFLCGPTACLLPIARFGPMALCWEQPRDWGAAQLVPDRHPGSSGTLASLAADHAPTADADVPAGGHRSAGGLGGQCMDPPDP